MDPVLIWQERLYWQSVLSETTLWGRGKVNGRLAMMEMRVTLAKLIWQYDISLKTEGQEEPAFFHRAVAAGQLEVRISRVERS